MVLNHDLEVEKNKAILIYDTELKMNKLAIITKENYKMLGNTLNLGERLQEVREKTFNKYNKSKPIETPNLLKEMALLSSYDPTPTNFQKSLISTKIP